jgi:hypothetical protein
MAGSWTRMKLQQIVDEEVLEDQEAFAEDELLDALAVVLLGRDGLPVVLVGVLELGPKHRLVEIFPDALRLLGLLFSLRFSLVLLCLLFSLRFSLRLLLRLSLRLVSSLSLRFFLSFFYFLVLVRPLFVLGVNLVLVLGVNLVRLFLDLERLALLFSPEMTNGAFSTGLGTIPAARSRSRRSRSSRSSSILSSSLIWSHSIRAVFVSVSSLGRSVSRFSRLSRFGDSGLSESLFSLPPLLSLRVALPESLSLLSLLFRFSRSESLFSESLSLLTLLFRFSFSRFSRSPSRSSPNRSHFSLAFVSLSSLAPNRSYPSHCAPFSSERATPSASRR